MKRRVRSPELTDRRVRRTLSRLECCTMSYRLSGRERNRLRLLCEAWDAVIETQLHNVIVNGSRPESFGSELVTGVAAEDKHLSATVKYEIESWARVRVCVELGLWPWSTVELRKTLYLAFPADAVVSS